jgi:hypothetical protein
MFCVTFNGFHKIWNQVKAPLQLCVDLRPTVFGAVSESDKTVIDGYEVDNQKPYYNP